MLIAARSSHGRCRSSGLKVSFITSSRLNSSWATGVAKEYHGVQSYVSTIKDPFLNLSIEHYLLKKSPPHSAVLFLYVNRPCIVIGRNQNPWLEVNLAVLFETASELGKVELVRRRSGGGAVFHDEGNVNWTVITPSDNFTRDKHVEMVVRALRSNNIDRARLNERHDIVLDQGRTRQVSDPNDFHRTPFTVNDESVKSLKVSGSAYKLTRGRALHHGTCLLDSPNLRSISQLLRSPARGFIKAKGVGSVSSPVSNIGLSTVEFKDAIQRAFADMYGSPDAGVIEVGSDAMEIPEIARGNEELLTSEWLWDQTPSFTLSSRPKESNSPASRVPPDLPPSFRAFMEFRHGQCTSASLSISSDPVGAAAEANRSFVVMHNRRLRDMWTWQDALSAMGLRADIEVEGRIAQWLQQMLPKPSSTRRALDQGRPQVE